ncbi:ATP-binding protein [Streptomyces sp. NRRL F-2664]|uniref:ATP-binding protein n=1 Tax=Streptomyces sp. NRRL F-2664 TaxID=1463842 RepID=UPI000691B542|nr:ATP-binding protein [Streptomyces sp. NRRL F-2664]
MLHPTVLSDIRRSPGVPCNAGEARDRIRALWESRGTPRAGSAAREDALTDVLLVTSELVTNAVRHGGGLLGFEAVLCAGGSAVRLRVSDGVSAAPPQPAVRPAGAMTGRGGFGWPLVHRLARSVTITPGAHGGKCIEAVVPLGPVVGPRDGPLPD